MPTSATLLSSAPYPSHHHRTTHMANCHVRLQPLSSPFCLGLGSLSGTGSAGQTAAVWTAPAMSQHSSWWPLDTTMWACFKTEMHTDNPVAEVLCAHFLCLSHLIDLNCSACLGGCNTADTQTWEHLLIPRANRLRVPVPGRTPQSHGWFLGRDDSSCLRTPTLCGTK